MSAAIRNRPRSGVRSRLVAVVALLVAGLVVLVVAPASTASAGRSTSGIKVDNKTKAATLVVRSVVIQGRDNRWELEPRVGETIAPRRSGHWELKTVSTIILATITFDIKDASGATVGEVQSIKRVDGTGWLWNYGAESNECIVSGPFTCLANGTDEVTVRDREYFEIGNRTPQLTFRITDVQADTGLEPRPAVGTN